MPERMKGHTQEKANGLIESELKPKHIEPPAEDGRLNYIVDIYAKWYQSYLHFCAKYRCPAPNCISEFFEIRFARRGKMGSALELGHFGIMSHSEWGCCGSATAYRI